MDWISVVGLLAFVGFPLYRAFTRQKRLREAARAREAEFVASLGTSFEDVAKVRPEPSPSPAQAALSGREAPVAAGRATGAQPRVENALAKALPAYLSDRQLRVFRVLRDAAPGTNVFVRAYLHWLVGAGAGEKPHRLDFVCCDEGARPRIAIDLEREDDEPAVCEFKRERLAAAGIRYLRWDAARLPGPEEIAGLLADFDRKA